MVDRACNISSINLSPDDEGNEMNYDDIWPEGVLNKEENLKKRSWFL